MDKYLTPDEILQLVNTGMVQLSDDLILRMTPKVSESYEDSDWYNDPNSTMSRHHYQSSTFKHTNSTIVMNIYSFNSSELDLIYDAIFERLGCTDSDKESVDCNNIISKMHMFCAMNED